METVVIKNSDDLANALERIVQRDAECESEAGLDEKLEATRAIVDAVRRGGDAAVAEFTMKFDGVSLEPEQFEVSPDEMDRAVAEVDPDLLAALQRAHDNISRFHEKNLRQSWEEVADAGTVLGQRITPIESAGVYVPGGTAFYPSSVLMNVVPARVAGVGEVVMVSPPSYGGTIHPLVLAAAQLSGATRVFRVGGAQAVAALAHGTERIPAVTKITGPGNVYVTLAKRLVSSLCDIDKEAGPSEVVVISDGTADARLAAAELLAQAEHDEDARATLIALSEETARQICAAVEEESETLSRAKIIQSALEKNGTVYVVDDLDSAGRLTNVIAPEHLSLQVKDPNGLFERIHHAGCAVLGAEGSVAIGDYYAGPNHILPTGRRARYASPLTAEDFRKVTSVISYTKEGAAKTAQDIIRLAEAERLTAHARAMELRR
jgi:histidinol dehydrogenase